jgi:RNA chaperone Hfq
METLEQVAKQPQPIARQQSATKQQPQPKMDKRPLTNREVHQTHDVQIGLLKRFKMEQTPLTVRLVVGDHLTGKIKRYDTFVIDFRSDDGRVNFLYKHGIVGFSTMDGMADSVQDEAA